MSDEGTPEDARLAVRLRGPLDAERRMLEAGLPEDFAAEVTGALLRDWYRGRYETADVRMVLGLLHRDDVDPEQAIAHAYETREICDAFAAANKTHHGHETLGPIVADGVFYAVTILKQPG